MKHNDYNPCMVLKIYTRNHADGVYMELHDVRSDGNKGFKEGAGRPLTLSAYKKLFALSGMAKDKIIPDFNNQILDPHMLCYKAQQPSRFICWYNPARKRRFEISKEVFNIWMPATLYYVYNEVLNIYALKSNKRPTLNTEIFKMPLPNLKSESTFCWGNVNTEKKIADQPIDAEVKAWEQMVWNSRFDSYNIGKYRGIYEDLQKSGKRFPKKELKPINKNLKNLFEL